MNHKQRNFGPEVCNQALMLVRTPHGCPTSPPRFTLMRRVTRLRGLLRLWEVLLQAHANLAITCVAQTYATKVPLANRVFCRMMFWHWTRCVDEEKKADCKAFAWTRFARTMEWQR